MKQKMVTFSLLILAVSLFSRGASGYEVHQDSVKADVDVSYARAYDASLEGMRSIGGLSIDKKSEGWVKTEVDHYSVAVHVEKLNDQKIQIAVSASRLGFPQPQYANDVLVEILKRAHDQPLWMR